jgi:hypothetical protein
VPFASGPLPCGFGAKLSYSFYLYLNTPSRLPCLNISDVFIIIVTTNVRIENEV